MRSVPPVFLVLGSGLIGTLLCFLFSGSLGHPFFYSLHSSSLVSSDSCFRDHKWDTVPRLKALYVKYIDELKEVRGQCDEYCKNASCLSTHFEMEILYMRLRETKPRVGIEMCPNNGYSTLWMLSALNKNNNGAQLFSFDMSMPGPKKIWLKNFATRSSWSLEEGNMELTFPKIFSLGSDKLTKLDFVFVDGGHEVIQAYWFRERVFDLVLAQLQHDKSKRAVLVSIHDVWNRRYAGGHMKHLSFEGATFFEWLGLHPSNVCNSFEWAKDNNLTRWQEFTEMRLETYGNGLGTCRDGGIVDMREWCLSLSLWFELVA